ncbi:MAG: hypothetical protein EON54_11195 [Alcaligenaceae bacterium]|nr:MAG: hypothetical protein EON54_11195 [Alcaligenaceae bacterium]
MNPRDALPGSAPARPSGARRAFVAVVIVAGLCELLATSPGLELDTWPAWLGGPVAMVGFLTFLLTGLIGTPILGNSLLALALLLLAWRGWRWPFWRALLLSVPFWVVGLRVLPVPW